MTQIRPNGIKVPTNSDAYNLTADLAIMADSINTPVAVANQAARDGLPKYPGLTVSRLDLPGAPSETWDGNKWSTSDVPWTSLPMVQGFLPLTTSDWPGMRYRVKNGVFTANGAVQRASAWGPDQVFALIPAAYRPGFRVQGANCQYQHTDGNLSFDTAGSSARAAFITWPLD